MSTIVLIILVLLLIGALPNFGFTANYGPSGILGAVLVVVLILVALGHI